MKPWPSFLFYKEKRKQDIPKILPHSARLSSWERSSKDIYRQLDCEPKVSKGDLNTVNPGDKPKGKENVPLRVGGGNLTCLQHCRSDSSQTCEEEISLPAAYLGMTDRNEVRAQRRQRLGRQWELGSKHHGRVNHMEKTHNHCRLRRRDWQRGTLCTHKSKAYCPSRSLAQNEKLESYWAYFILVSGSAHLEFAFS